MLAPKCRVFAASCGNLASGTFIWKPHHIFCSRLHIILSRKCHTSVCRWEVLTTFVGWATSTITSKTCYFKTVTALIQNPHQIFCSRSHVIFSRKCPTSVRMWDLLTTFMGRARSTITLESCCFRAVTTITQNPHQIFCSRSPVILSRQCPTSVCRWEVLTTFVGWATSTITSKTCYFKTVTALIQNPHQIFCSRSHVIFSRKCPTSVRMWDLLTTFMGRARSTITLESCCFRAVTTITRNPHQIFCSRSPVILSRQCPTSVCRWEVVTTFVGWATSTITSKTCYFKTVTKLDQIPHQIFCSRSHVIFSRKCPTSVRMWDLLTTFMGRARSTVTLESCCFRAVTTITRNPHQIFCSRSPVILSKQCPTSVCRWEVVTTSVGWATSTITSKTCYFKTVTKLDQIPHQIFCSRSHVIFSRKCPTSVRMWDLLTTFMGRARSTITLESCCFRAVTTITRNPHQIFCSRSPVILSRQCPTSVCRWEVVTTFVGWATSTITSKTCYFKTVTKLDQIPHQIFCSRSHVIFSRKCPTSVRMWDLLTTFMGRARSTVTLESCCFRAVTTITRNPHQIFCSRSPVILSKQCPTSVCRWEVVTTSVGWATSTITSKTCYFKTVTKLDQIPHQIFCSRSHVIFSRKCPTSVRMWDLLTTFMGRARSTITLELCCFRAVTALIQNPHQIFCSRSHIIFCRKCPTSVRMWDLLTTFMGRARSTITLELCCFRAVTTITRNPHQIFCSRSPVKLSRQCPTSVCRWEVLTTFVGWATSTITSKTCYFKTVTELDQIPHQIFCSRSHAIFSRKCPTSVRMWDLLTTFMGRARSTITLEWCCFRAVTALIQNPHQIFCSRSPILLPMK